MNAGCVTLVSHKCRGHIVSWLSDCITFNPKMSCKLSHSKLKCTCQRYADGGAEWLYRVAHFLKYVLPTNGSKVKNKVMHQTLHRSYMGHV